MYFTGLAIVAFIVSVFAKPTPYYDNYPIRAIVVLGNTSQNTTGIVSFTQNGPNEPTLVYAKIAGLVPGTKHGFHIHETGDLSGGCETLGPHYNPFNQTHGGPFSEIRHVGDFGNIEQQVNQDVASLSLSIATLKLDGPTSVIGRGLVLHSGEDDLGLGDSPLSKTVGNSGARLACGVIGIAAAETTA